MALKNSSLFLILLLATTSAYSISFSDFKQALLGTFDEYATGVPHGNLQTLNWSDPNLSDTGDIFGLSSAFFITSYPTEKLKKLFSLLDDSNSFQGSMVSLPNYSVALRFSNKKYPLDFALSVGYIPQWFPSGSGIFNYEDLAVSTDIRYSAIKNPDLFNLSLGIGLGYSGSSFSHKVDGDFRFSVADYSEGDLRLLNSILHLKNDRYTFELNSQISKRIELITPFIGVSSYASFGTTSFSFDSVYMNNVTNWSFSNQDIAELTGLTGLTFSRNRISLENSSLLYFLNVFAGTSIDFDYLIVDYQFFYTVGTRALVNSVSVRFQV